MTSRSDADLRCRLLVATSLDAVLLTVPNGRILAANPAACEMFGRTEEEICRVGRAGLVDLTDPRLAKAVVERERTGRFRGELSFLRSDGTQFPGEVSSAVFRDDAGEMRTSMIVRDISAQKAAEAAIRDSERFVRGTLDALPDHIAILDESGRIVDVNRAWRGFAEANGAASSAVCEGANYLGVCDAATGEDARPGREVAAALRAILAGERTNCAFEYPCHSREQERWFTVRATCFEGRGRRVVVTHENITPTKRAEADVRASEERFRAIADYTADWETWLDPFGAVVWVNPSVERVTGYTVAECQRMPGFPIPLIAEADRPAALRAWPTAPTPTSGRDLQFRFTRRDGSIRWGEVSWQPIYAAGGKWLGHRSSVRDVTERRLAREQALALAARLQDVREEERTRMAREIHDVLAQGLTRLKIDLVWLRGRIGRSPTPESAMTLIERVGDMSQLADEAIRTVQRIATELRPVVLDSLGLCAAVEWQTRELVERTAIRCCVDVPDDELPIGRDAATAAFRILQEGLTNVVRHAEATEVAVTLAADATHASLTIRDNGRGIPAELLSDPRSIGLTGMRERALLVGGELRVVTQRGAGTTIHVRLPLGVLAPRSAL